MTALTVPIDACATLATSLIVGRRLSIGAAIQAIPPAQSAASM